MTTTEGATITPAKPVRVWIVEDNAAYRQSLTRVVQRINADEPVSTFGNCEEALEAIGRNSAPEVLLLDLGLPGMNGVEGLPRFKAAAPNMRIIALTSFDDREWIFKAICAGASGYLLKTTPLSQVTAAISEVMAGGAPMNPEVASVVLNMFAKLGAGRSGTPEYGLSARERETLQGMVDGLTAKEIAARMKVSYHTIDTYVRSIYTKLHVQSRGGAVAKAIREQLYI
jgi:DNA-binding NarL/FixJ family response regulator